MSDSWNSLQNRLRSTPKRWVITGVAGFIGSGLLHKLLELNQYVVAGDNFATGHQANLDEIKGLVTAEQWSRFTFYEGDIRDTEFCNRLCHGSDIILHQGALGSVPRSIEDPLTSHQANVDGFLNMLIAARDAKAKRFVYASSSSVYGDHPALPKIESQIGEQLSPYAVTKYVNELYASVFAKRYPISTIGLRYFNVFGPRQDPSGPYAAVIPLFTKALVSGEPALIYGDGKTSRDFCYIENVVQANLLAGCTENDQAINQAYNVAVGEQLSLLELHEMLSDCVVKLTGKKTLPPEHLEFRDGDVRHSLADISKAETLLGFRPTHRASDALAEYVRWFIQKRVESDPPTH